VLQLDGSRVVSCLKLVFSAARFIRRIVIVWTLDQIYLSSHTYMADDSANILTLNCSKTEFLTIFLKNQLHSARDLGFIFDEHLTFSSLSKSCYSHIRELRCIRPYLDSKTSSTIAASIVHFKLDYCNSL